MERTLQLLCPVQECSVMKYGCSCFLTGFFKSLARCTDNSQFFSHISLPRTKVYVTLNVINVVHAFLFTYVLQAILCKERKMESLRLSSTSLCLSVVYV